ncbi:MAG: A24 family peptidase C-terminal domain-containing protein [Nitrosotalea sp.]
MLVENLDLNVLRISIALCMLLIASILDMRKREINDILWIGFGVVAAILILISGDPWSTVKSVGISMIIAPIVLVIWRLGVFGGADAFCLIVLASLAPMISLHDYQITPLTTLTNAAIISTMPLFVNLGRNLIAVSRKEDIFNGIKETKLNKVVALFVGYRAKTPKHSFSMERIEGNQRRLNLGLQHAETTEFCKTSDTWVTPGVPYIIYISLGFVIQIIYGDIIFNFIHSF